VWICCGTDRLVRLGSRMAQYARLSPSRDFIKRLNLAALAERVNDGSVLPLSVCTRVERLTLTNCEGLTDSGLIGLVTDSSHLLALDISGDLQITEASMLALADNCRRLQGLNISGCTRISNESMIKVAENCKYVKRVSHLRLLSFGRLLTNSSSNLTTASNSKTTPSLPLLKTAQTSSKSTSINADKSEMIQSLLFSRMGKAFANCDLPTAS
jgi:hypothetical protein